jgi:hypothetical protein
MFLILKKLDLNNRNTRGFTELNGHKSQSFNIFNGISVSKVEPDGLGTQHRCLSAFEDT